MREDAPLFPEQASTIAPQVDALTLYLVAVSGLFALLIVFFIFYFAVRYRRRPGVVPRNDTRGQLALEVTWTVIPLVLTMVMFAWGAKLYFTQAAVPDGALEVYVVGKQWMWKLQHSEGRREINQLHVPVGRPVKLIMTSEDVIHSFYIPAFRVKRDVVPGRYSYAWFEATRTGEFHLFCAEYCGTSHSQMGGSVIVMEPSEYGLWLSGREAAETPVQAGEKLFNRLQCNTCHAADSGNRGPSLEGLFGSEVKLRDGRTVVADESYIRESILNPGTKIVAGYEPIMPSYEAQLGEDDILLLIAYIKSLGAEPEESSAR